MIRFVINDIYELKYRTKETLKEMGNLINYGKLINLMIQVQIFIVFIFTKVIRLASRLEVVSVNTIYFIQAKKHFAIYFFFN